MWEEVRVGDRMGQGAAVGLDQRVSCGLESRAHLVPRAKQGCCAEGRGDGLLPLL